MLEKKELESLVEFRVLEKVIQDIVPIIVNVNQMEFELLTRRWKKGKKTYSSDDVAKGYINDTWSYTYPDTLKAIKFIEDQYENILQLKKKTASYGNSVYDSFKKRFYERISGPAWTELDETAWKDIKYVDFEDKTLIVAPTGRGKEYKVIGQDYKEVYKNLITMGRLEYISKEVVDVLNKKIYGQKFVDITEIDGSTLPGSLAEILYKPKAIWQDLVIIGVTLTSTSRITVQDYIQKSLERFLSIPSNRIEIKNVISNNPDEPCFRFIDLTMKKGNCDTWKNWMDETFENPEICKKLFMAWVGGVVVAKNNSKQVFWIHDPTGNSGKSQVINALSNYLGSASVALDKNSMSNQFGFAKLENKRLVTISDNKNPELLRTSFLHKCTGGDMVDIERKGKDSYSARMFAKILICENIAPTINADEANQISRLIYVKCRRKTKEDYIRLGIGKYDENGEFIFIGSNEFPEKLIEETEAFIAECLDVYKKECPNNSQIAVPESYIEDYITINCADISETFDIDILNRHFEIGTEDDVIETDAFWNKIVEIFDGGFDKKNYKHTQNINKLITNIFNCRMKQLRQGTKRIRVFCGMKLKQDDSWLDNLKTKETKSVGIE